MSENTELTTVTEGGTALSIFTNTDSFELAQRAGKMLASSDLVPKQFQNNIPNCVIALNIASRLGADPFAVLQSLYIVHGRPAWSSQFLIAMVNASGRYSPLQFRMTGQGDSAACVAWARHLQTDEVVEGPEVSIAMAKAEGWYGKAGSKWVTLPKLMLMYRSAGFFARLYCPDLCLGMRTMEEESDIGKTAKEAPVFTASPTQTVTKVDGEDTVVIDAEETTKDDFDPRANALSKVLELVTNSDATPDQIDTVLRARGVLGETGTIPRLGEAKLKDIADEFASIEAEALASSDPVML